MEEKILKNLMIALIALLINNDIASAEGNYASLTVSCTIPAIPGVNAPPYDTESPQGKKQIAAQAAAEAEAETEAKDNPSQNNVIVEKAEEPSRLVKTVYSR